MAEIVLTNGSKTLVDDVDFDRLNERRWSENNGYVMNVSAGTTTYMHREIMGAPQGLEVDHINRDRRDNRRANLRLATRSQQCANTPRAPGLSGFRGVSPVSGKWRARLWRVGFKAESLGSFDTPEAAALAYDARAREIWGPYATLNFPDIAA